MQKESNLPLMSKATKYFFVIAIIFSIYHLIRDLLQTYNQENWATQFLKMKSNWCGPYCNYITFPFEIYIFFSSIIILRRKRFGLLGYSVIAILFIWSAMFLYDFLIFN